MPRDFIGEPPDYRFFPCNDTEKMILDTLSGKYLDLYKDGRNAGDSVSQSLLVACKEMKDDLETLGNRNG